MVDVYDPAADSVTYGLVETEHAIVAEAHAVYVAAIHLNTAGITEAVVLTDSITTVRWLSGRMGQHEDVYRTAQPYIRKAFEKLSAAWQDGWVLAWIPRKLNKAHKPLERAT